MPVAEDFGQHTHFVMPVADILVFSGAVMALKHNGSDGEQIDALRMRTTCTFVPVRATGVVVVVIDGRALLSDQVSADLPHTRWRSAYEAPHGRMLSARQTSRFCLHTRGLIHAHG